MALSGVRHVALTVTDLDRSVGWYTEVLGFTVMFREEGSERAAAVMRVPDTDLIVGLVRFAGGAHDAFDPARTGLDHLCFEVADDAELEQWLARFDEHDVEHSGIASTATGSMLNFEDPDGIALTLATPMPAGG